MQSEKSLRWDTLELKAQLLKKVGEERFKRYFFCLNRFINHKLSKSECDKSCYRILGRENLALHNRIIRAILKNACSAKTPPPLVNEVGPTSLAVEAALEDGQGHGQYHDQIAIVAQNQTSVAPNLSNGIVHMSRAYERNLIDRPSPLRPNGKVDHGSCTKSTENGDLMGIKDGEEVEQGTRLKASRSPLLAPLGIPFCPASIGGARKSSPLIHIGNYISCFDISGLYDSDMLRRRMEQIAVSQGLGGVTMECANTLNNMLDVYMKRLIRSCLELVGTRSMSNVAIFDVWKQQNHGKIINGMWPSNMQNGGPLVEEPRVHNSVSLLDFKVAMELNPQQLGEDWPLLLEKISMETFEK